MHRVMRVAMGAGVALAVAGCGGDDKPTGPVKQLDGEMTARISSVYWYAGLVVDASLSAGTLTLIGQDNEFQEITFQVTNVTAPGAYQLGAGTANTASLAINASSVWQATSAAGTGSVVITTLTATRAVGTFSFTGVPRPGSAAVGQGNRVVSEGTFDVKLD